MEELRQITDLRNLVDVTNDDNSNQNDWEMLDGVLRGSTALAISNYGGELKDVLEKLTEECRQVKRFYFICHVVYAHSISFVMSSMLILRWIAAPQMDGPAEIAYKFRLMRSKVS